jgi:hypothetical protein
MEKDMSAHLTFSKTLMLAALVLLALAAPGDALAKKKGKKGKKGKDSRPTVELVDISSMDGTFKQLRKLDNKVYSAEKEVDKSQRNLNKALGIKNDTPIKKGLSQLQKRADGKISVATGGKVPKLQATDAVPKNIEEAIAAVNLMSTSFSAALTDLADVPKESEKLSKQVGKFPASLKDEFTKDGGSFIDVLFKLPKVAKGVLNNVAIATSLPGRATGVVGQMTNIVGSITSTFSPL